MYPNFDVIVDDVKHLREYVEAHIVFVDPLGLEIASDLVELVSGGVQKLQRAVLSVADGLQRVRCVV